METLFLRVVWLSATVSAVLLPLLLASRWLQSRVKAKSLYILWLLLAVRLVVPVEITLPKPAVTVQVPQYEVTIPTNRPSGELPDDQLSPVEPNVEPSLPQTEQEPDLTAQTEVPVAVVLGTLWLTGVFAIALIQISSYLVTRRALLRWARPVSPETREQIQYLALRLGLKRTFQVRRSDRVRTAMVLGVLRPVLLLPQEECDPLVVLHELNHLRRRDLEYKGLMMAACWLHWFNPLVWWMSRVAGRNLELCCDEDVAGKENSAFRHRYGRLLLECAAEGAGPVLSSRFGSSKEELKARLTNLFVAKKRGRALVCLALACAVLAGGLVACEQTQNSGPDQAVEELEDTITYDGQTVSFTLPEGERDWSLHIAGRAEVEWLGGMSLHYLDETAWTPGETYSFDLDGESVGDITELSMYIDLEGQSYTVDLLPYVSEYSKPYPYYRNYDYGFTLTLPEGWAEGVDIQKMDGGVDFCMKNAGDWDGAGWLVGIYLTDPASWQETADAGCPHGERFLGQSAQGVLFAAGPSDLPCDETIPGALERYETMYADVDELLDSFRLDSMNVPTAQGDITVWNGLPYACQENGWTALSEQPIPLPREWEDQMLEGEQALPNTGTFLGRMMNERQGWLVAAYDMGQEHNTYVYRTQDAGATWEEQGKPQWPSFILTGVGFVDEERIILAGRFQDGTGPCMVSYEGGVIGSTGVPDDGLISSNSDIIIKIYPEEGEVSKILVSYDEGSNWTSIPVYGLS